MLTLNGEILDDYESARMFGHISGANFDLDSLKQALDCSKDFNGVGIIYSESGHNFIVRSSKTNNLTQYVVVTKLPHVTRNVAAEELKKTVQSPSITKEVTSMALSCGGAALAISVDIVASGAVPITFGASGAIAALAIAGTYATIAQCVNGFSRVIDVTLNDGHVSIWLDSQEWYVTTSNALDIISLASAGDAFKEAFFTWKASTGGIKKMIDWLRTLNWHERKKLTEAIMRKYNPGISNEAISAFIKVGKYPKRFPTNLIQLQLQRQLILSINSMVAFSGSVYNGELHQPAMDLYGYAIGLIQSFEVIE